jgi:hypothetical protein
MLGNGQDDQAMDSATVSNCERPPLPRWVIMRTDGAYWTGSEWTFDRQQSKSWINPSAAQAEALRIRGWVQQVGRMRLMP